MANKFLAMPNKQRWEEGYRPAWMLTSDRDPPENYEDGIKMYRSYIKTGLVIYPPNMKKNKYDKNSSIAYNYMKKYNRKR